VKAASRRAPRVWTAIPPDSRETNPASHVEQKSLYGRDRRMTGEMGAAFLPNEANNSFVINGAETGWVGERSAAKVGDLDLPACRLPITMAICSCRAIYQNCSRASDLCAARRCCGRRAAGVSDWSAQVDLNHAEIAYKRGDYEAPAKRLNQRFPFSREPTPSPTSSTNYNHCLPRSTRTQLRYATKTVAHSKRRIEGAHRSACHLESHGVGIMICAIFE